MFSLCRKSQGIFGNLSCINRLDCFPSVLGPSELENPMAKGHVPQQLAVVTNLVKEEMPT
jgi:hypothetical protein